MIVYQQKAVCDFIITGPTQVNKGDTISLSDGKILTITKDMGKGCSASVDVCLEMFEGYQLPIGYYINQITIRNIVKE